MRLLGQSIALATFIAYFRAWTKFCKFTHTHKLSDIAFWLKILGLPVITDDFLICKLLAGITKLAKTPDTRAGIDLVMLKKILTLLGHMHLSTYDYILFHTIFI